MSAPDTSTVAIGALALEIGTGALCGADKCRIIRVGDCACASIDATLRALAAERDTALRRAAIYETSIAVAAARGTALDAARAEVAALRKALEYYAKDHERPNDGPWGAYSEDFGNVARAALKGPPA